MQLAQGLEQMCKSSIQNAGTTVSNYYDYSTMNNTITKEADIDISQNNSQRRLKWWCKIMRKFELQVCDDKMSLISRYPLDLTTNHWYGF